MKKCKMKNVLKIVILFATLAVAIFFLCKATDKMNRGQQQENLIQLEHSLKKAVMTCYATEGVYPPTIQYLKENYGIQIDEKRYHVFYEIHGSNLMPSITVMESENE